MLFLAVSTNCSAFIISCPVLGPCAIEAQSLGSQYSISLPNICNFITAECFMTFTLTIATYTVWLSVPAVEFKACMRSLRSLRSRWNLLSAGRRLLMVHFPRTSKKFSKVHSLHLSSNEASSCFITASLSKVNLTAVSISFSLLKGHWQPKFLLLISIRYTYGILNFIFWPVCRV